MKVIKKEWGSKVDLINEVENTKYIIDISKLDVDISTSSVEFRGEYINFNTSFVISPEKVYYVDEQDNIITILDMENYIIGPAPLITFPSNNSIRIFGDGPGWEIIINKKQIIIQTAREVIERRIEWLMDWKRYGFIIRFD